MPNPAKEFKLLPVPQTNAELIIADNLRELLESMHQANIMLLQEVAKLREEVNVLKG